MKVKKVFHLQNVQMSLFFDSRRTLLHTESSSWKIPIINIPDWGQRPTKSRRGKDWDGKGICIGSKREGDWAKQVCPARGKGLQRPPKDLTFIFYGERSKSLISRLAVAKIQKNPVECKFSTCFFTNFRPIRLVSSQADDYSQLQAVRH